MIIYNFISNKKSLNLNDITSFIEGKFFGIKLNTFIPNPFPSQNQIIEVHGSIGIINNNGSLTIQIIFFEDKDNWREKTITQNGITITYTKGVYSNIPTQSELHQILEKAGYL